MELRRAEEAKGHLQREEEEARRVSGRLSTRGQHDEFTNERLWLFDAVVVVVVVDMIVVGAK